MKSLKYSAVAMAAVALTAAASLSARAVPIAIVDSGTDLNHPELVNVQWTNLGDEDDAVDNDDNGYIDDTHGWNFAENNNKLFDKKFLGTFSKDVYTFFEYQTKKLKGTGTPEELEWMKSHIADPAFLEQLQTFGNFVHGTHVAGIASKESPKAQIMPLKLIATKAPKPFSVIEKNGMVAAATAASGDDIKKKLVLLAIDALGKQQSAVFAPIAAYMKLEGAKVANCSFGTGFAQAKALLGPLLSKIFGGTLPDADLNFYASYFVNAVSKGTEASFINGAPDTLFVIAAGNDGTNNDEFPASPANIKAANTITVAATNGYSAIASFSNFGTKSVDVAAPGVGILSSIPGGEHVFLSGTSQAAPYVANIAGQIMDANPKLTPSQVRAILMGTTDQKAYLLDKVTSGGIANGKRAAMAAMLTNTVSMEEAISRSMRDVRDHEEMNFTSLADQGEAFVLPLPSVSY